MQLTKPQDAQVEGAKLYRGSEKISQESGDLAGMDRWTNDQKHKESVSRKRMEYRHSRQTESTNTEG